MKKFKVYQESWDSLKDKSIRQDKLRRRDRHGWLVWALWREVER